MKVFFFILGGILLVALGIYGFGSAIYNQRTCDWANIDNIEMHAKLDIPKINDCSCEYKKELNTKIASFDIDKNRIGMKAFILYNKFKKLNTINDVAFDTLLKNKSRIKSLNSDYIYYTIGSIDGEIRQTLLDTMSGRLWVFIKYRD